jgi:hypothetical protein
MEDVDSRAIAAVSICTNVVTYREKRALYNCIKLISSCLSTFIVNDVLCTISCLSR